MPISRSHTHIGSMIQEEDEDEQKPYCPYCREVIQRIIYLGEREDYDGEDAHLWRQCPCCKTNFPVKDVPHEDEEDELPWPTDEEEQTTTHEDLTEGTVFNRKKVSKMGRLSQFRKRAQDAKLPKDQEVVKLIKQGKQVENYTEYIPGE